MRIRRHRSQAIASSLKIRPFGLQSVVVLAVGLALVATVVLWRVRKADAERNIAREKAMKRKQEQRKEAITPEKYVEWPVIIRPTGNRSAEEGKELQEPSMTTIEFKPVDHPSLQS